MKVPPVGANINDRRSANAGRTTRHCGCKVSLRIGKRIEEAFGWSKTVVGRDKRKFRGRAASNGLHVRGPAYDLARCRN